MRISSVEGVLSQQGSLTPQMAHLERGQTSIHAGLCPLLRFLGKTPFDAQQSVALLDALEEVPTLDEEPHPTACAGHLSSIDP
ncbi:hypothetical protein L0F63_005338 [Massospora cicadina]|nr:hypothetical protein L0F63_005338 [Massospora cicadina]